MPSSISSHRKRGSTYKLHVLLHQSASRYGMHDAIYTGLQVFDAAVDVCGNWWRHWSNDAVVDFPAVGK